MIRAMLALAGALALGFAAQPAAAQDAPAEEGFAAFAQLLAVEPLTAEQQARLPAARAVVGKMMPPGSMGEVMGSMFEGLINPVAQVDTSDPAAEVARRLGVDSSELAMTPDQAAEAAAMIDPAWQERREREAALVPAMMTSMMSAMEPAMREAMAELYAIYFDARQLTDIGAFFETPSGAAFARSSTKMAGDPRLAARMFATMGEMPELFGGMDELESGFADLPAPRGYDELTPAQRKRLSALTGVSDEDLSWRLSSSPMTVEIAE